MLYIIKPGTRPGVIFILEYKSIILQIFKACNLCIIWYMLQHHFVAANALHRFYGSGYLTKSILKTTRSIGFRVTPESLSNRTSLEAWGCFSIWDRYNRADMLDFDFLLNMPCPSTRFFFITRTENVIRTL